MCMLCRQEREQGRTTARVEEKEGEKMEGIREAAVNERTSSDQIFLNVTELKCLLTVSCGI